MMNWHKTVFLPAYLASVIIALAGFPFLFQPIIAPLEVSPAALPIGISFPCHIPAGRAVHLIFIDTLLQNNTQPIGKIVYCAFREPQFFGYPLRPHLWVMLLYEIFIVCRVSFGISRSSASLRKHAALCRAVSFSYSAGVINARSEQCPANRALNRLQHPSLISAGGRTEFICVSAWKDLSRKWLMAILASKRLYHGCLRFRLSEFENRATARRTVLSAVHEAALALKNYTTAIISLLEQRS